MLPTDRLLSRAFISFTGTQFLGAFNDNVYKQVMLLFALTAASAGGNQDQQGVITMVFSLPFILFSGYSGQAAERFSKSAVMVFSKYLELGIMLIGLFAFASKSFPFMVAVLFLMGAQSTLFAPSKYGALPELIAPNRLTAANGWVQMTTFVAIILGTALAGLLMKHFRSRMELAGFACSFVALLGIAAVHALPKLHANRPALHLEKNPFGRVFSTVAGLRRDPVLGLVLAANCFFWFSGVMVVQIVNNYGKNVLKLDEARISLLLVWVSVGIMVGCLLAARVEKSLGPARTVLVGAIGIALFQALLYFHHMPLALIHAILLAAGAASGLYYVPLACLLQSRPPLGEKGEVLAAMNFLNFVAMFLAGLFWKLLVWLGVSTPQAWVLLGAAMAVLILGLMPGLRRYL